MKFVSRSVGWVLCAVLAGCAVPQRDVQEIAQRERPVLAAPGLPEAEPPPPRIGSPPVDTARPPIAPAVRTAAVIRQRRMPDFPAALAHEGIDGQVIAVFYVGAEGRAEDVLIERSPHPLLSKAVTDALKGWRFEPARAADGQPVRTRMRVPFRFRSE